MCNHKFPQQPISHGIRSIGEVIIYQCNNCLAIKVERKWQIRGSLEEWLNYEDSKIIDKPSTSPQYIE